MRGLIITFCILVHGVSLSQAEVWVEGTSQPDERITISSPVEEIVESVPVKEGDVVTQGSVLATLVATSEQLQVKLLALQIEKVAKDVETTRRLVEKEMRKKSQLLEEELELETLKVQKEIAQAEVDQRVIEAPVAGVIVHRLKDPGEAVGRVEPVFEIIDASKMKLAFILSTEYLAILQEGMELAVVFPELPGIGEQKAKLVFIDPQVDSRSGLFRVRFEFDNRKLKIKPGLRVKVKLPEVKSGE